MSGPDFAAQFAPVPVQVQVGVQPTLDGGAAVALVVSGGRLLEPVTASFSPDAAVGLAAAILQASNGARAAGKPGIVR